MLYFKGKTPLTFLQLPSEQFRRPDCKIRREILSELPLTRYPE
jgi:hypothetical protein